MGDGDLDGFGIKLPGEVKRPLNGFLGFAGKANDEVTMDGDAYSLAVFDEGAGHFQRGAFLDIPENLGVARFKAHNKQPRARVGHGFQRFVVAMAARRTGPAKAKGLELPAQVQDAVLADIKSIIVKEELLGLGEQFQSLADFFHHVIRGANAPGVAGQRLRPQTKRAECRAAARCVKCHVRMEEKRNVVILDHQVALVHRSGKR